MSIRLRELIRAVRACKTAAEERDVIAKESAALREAFREQDQRYRHRNVAKLMYIHMLGYPTHFGQMETLKLIAANGFPEKRIGYLGLMILLDERQEVLMLVTNSLKMDLNNHKNQYTVGLALAALGNICSAEMARDLAPDVERLLESSNPYIRKKAALCAIRVLKKNPELVEQFIERATELLHDKNHGVLLSGVSLLLAICTLDPPSLVILRPLVPLLAKTLRTLLQSGFNPEYDVGGICNPFLQVKILQLLRMLGAGSAEASDAMTDVLAQVASNVEGARNAGNAILYEAVKAIMGIDTIGGLRVMGVNILGRFLANKDNNIRYVALNTLSSVVGVDTAAVQRHRATIVDCVKDADVSIRRRALELVYSLVNESNIRNLTRELLDYLAVCDAEFKPDLTAKVAALITRFAPDKRWHFDSLLAVLVQAGPYVKEHVVRGLLALVSSTPPLHAYATRALYRAIIMPGPSAPPGCPEPPLLQAALWALGEYGELLPLQPEDLPASGMVPLEGELPLRVSDAALVGVVESALTRPKVAHSVREYALTAAAKLAARLPAQAARLNALLARYTPSSFLEVQARACEFSRMLQHEAEVPRLLARMPELRLDEDLVERDSGTGTGVTDDGGGLLLDVGEDVGGKREGTASGTKAAAGDLVELLGGLDAAVSGVAAISAGGIAAVQPTPAVSALDDLLGVGGGAIAVPPVVSGGGDILDLLDGASSTGMAAGNVAAMPASTPAPASLAVNPVADMLGGGPALDASWPSIVAFQCSDVSISFAFSKPQPANPGLTDITATITNTGLGDIADFGLQAAVPKFMALRLEPASSTALPATGAAITQRIHISNSMQGQKSVVMRLRLAWKAGGAQVTEQVEVSNFPPGL